MKNHDLSRSQLLKENEQLHQTNKELKKSAEISKIGHDETEKLAHIGSWTLGSLTDNAVIWSDELYRIFGLEIGEITPTYEAVLAFIHDDDKEYYEQAVQNSIETKEEFNIEVRIIRKDGAVRYIDSRSTAIYGNQSPELVHSFGTVQDITDKKLIEKELEERNQHLEKLVEERTSSLQLSVDLMSGREIRMVELKKINLKNLQNSYPRRKRTGYYGILPLRVQIFLNARNPRSKLRGIQRRITDLRKQLRGAGIKPKAFDPLLGPDKEW